MLLLAACVHRPPGLREPIARSTGSGSAPIDVDDAFTDDLGASGPFRLISPGGLDHPGVLFFFTPDFGKASYADAAEKRADLAASHGLVMVAMGNPNRPYGSGCWWSPDVVGAVTYVDAFLEDVLVPEFDVDPDRVFLTGLSGGSDFAAEFLYHTGYRYEGGSVALCGGDVPRLDGGSCLWQEDPPAAPAPSDLDAEVLDGVRYDYAIDATDPLLGSSAKSASFYEDAGFAHVTHRVVDGDGHCGFADGSDGLDELADGLDLVDPLAGG